MCGIAGAMTKSGQSLPQDILFRMQDRLYHRGPDSKGHFVTDSVGLVHTRLSIIDTEGGRQPFEHPDGLILVANGEIYNDPDIRKLLKDEPFQTGSDNESALHLYNRYGLDFAQHIRGMYALALYDPAQDQLVLARDPFGIKPLYVAETSQALWFASEPQVLLNADVVPRAELGVIRDQLLGLQFTCGRQSIFQGIHRVAPGEVLVVKAGQIAERRNVPPFEAAGRSDIVSLDQFDQHWSDTVRVHRRSDVPYGAFLSSGTDSTAVLAAMASQEAKPVLTFTAGFAGGLVHDERARAQSVAAALGATHCSIEIGPKDFWANLPNMAAALDDPVADYAIVPTYLLAQEAAKSVKVVLTGEGGDEVLAGYGRYRAARRPWPLRKRVWSRHALERVGVLRESKTGWRDHIAETEQTLANNGLTKLQQIQHLDVTHWLPNDLLTKVDRCLMAHGVEGRVPFLDTQFAKFGFRLPDRQKVQNRHGKYVLRQWLQQRLPEADSFARKKGFSVPVGAWIADEGGRLGSLVARQSGILSVCQTDKTEALFRHASQKTALAVWVLLFYALWHQIHIRGVKPVGSVFDVLSERVSA